MTSKRSAASKRAPLPRAADYAKSFREDWYPSTDNREVNFRELWRKSLCPGRNARDVIAVFTGGQAKKIPTDTGWDFENWWQFEI